MNISFKYRIKNKLGTLRLQARSVNFVWNFCNETQKSALRTQKRNWPSGFDLNYLTAGSSKVLKLHSGTIQAVGEQYVKSRLQRKRPFLKWRSTKKNGWVPFKGRHIKAVVDGPSISFLFNKNNYKVFCSRPLPENCIICDGSSFSEDAEGHWYLNLVIEVPEVPQHLSSIGEIKSSHSVGIDLGLKDFAVLSTGEVIEAPKFYRKLESKLGINQRAKKKKHVRKLHARIKNARKDFHHKLSTRLVKEFEAIAVGNVNAKALVQTKMAKSVLDAGWSSFRTMLCYKAIRHGVYYEEVKENFTTQTCSSCGNKTGPKGLSGLGVRFWKCSQCTAIHNRDCNAAKNIQARLGHQTL